MFKPREQIFNKVSVLVEVGIKIRIRGFAVGSLGNDWVHVFASYLQANFFGVVTFVGDQIFAADVVNYRRCSFGVVDLTPSDFKIERISMRIGGHVYFSCGSAA